MKMPFGKFKGVPVRDLPDDYLDWLFTRELRARLRREVSAEWYARFENQWRDPIDHAVGELDPDESALLTELLRAGFRALAMKYHPDHGGNANVMKKLNSLMERLRGARLAA